MNLLHSPVIGQALGLAPVGDRGEGMVEQSRVDGVPPQLPRQPVMAVKINLQTEGAPGGSANIPQAQLFIEEIKVVVQAFAVVGPQVGLPSFLVVPRLVGGTRFHGREDAHQAGVMPPLLEDLLDPIFFAEVLFTKEDNLQAVLGGESLGILSQGVAQRLSKAGIIKNPDLPSLQVGGHALGLTEPRQGSLDQEAVVAGKHAHDFVGMLLGQQFHGPSSSCSGKQVQVASPVQIKFWHESDKSWGCGGKAQGKAPSCSDPPLARPRFTTSHASFIELLTETNQGILESGPGPRYNSTCLVPAMPG